MGWRRSTQATINNKQAMTYFELLEILDNLPEDQLDAQVFAMIDDEIYPVKQLSEQEGSTEQMNDGHPYLDVE